VETLTAQKMRQLLVFIEQINLSCESEALTQQLLSALTTLIPGDYVSLNIFNRNLEMEDAAWNPVDQCIPAEEQAAILDEHVSEHPFTPIAVQDWQLPATCMSDVFSQRKLRQTGLYNELYRPLGIEYQLGVGVPTSDNKLLVIAHSRDYRDFNKSEKQLLQVAGCHIHNRLEFANKQMQLSRHLKLLLDFNSTESQGLVILSGDNREQWVNQYAHELIAHYFPHESSNSTKLPSELRAWLKQQQENLDQIQELQPFIIRSESKELHIDLLEVGSTEVGKLLRMEERYRGLPTVVCERFDLTPRESEVLEWVIKGKTNIEIGMLLSIRHTTIKKHLEHIYNKLDVYNRTAAVGKVQQAIQNMSK